MTTVHHTAPSVHRLQQAAGRFARKLRNLFIFDAPDSWGTDLEIIFEHHRLHPDDGYGLDGDASARRSA